MLLSLRHKFIFVHIPKTGGTSIRNALEFCSEDIRPYLNDNAKIMVANRQSAGLSINPPHINLVDAAKMLTINLQDFLVVCIVRHPVDRLISYYKYLKFNNPNHRLHDLAANTNVDEFAEQFMLDKGHDTKPQFAYFAPTEELIVKGHYVLRCENLEEDFSKLRSNLGLPPIKLGRLNQSKRITGLSLSNESENLLMAFEAQTVGLMGYC